MNNVYVVYILRPHSISQAVFYYASAVRTYIRYLQKSVLSYGEYTLDVRVGQQGWDLNDFQPCPYDQL